MSMTALVFKDGDWRSIDVPLDAKGKPFVEISLDTWDRKRKRFQGDIYRRLPNRYRLEYEFKETEFWGEVVHGVSDFSKSA